MGLKKNGFSIVETMVAMGIMSVALLGVLQLMTMQMKVSNTTKLDTEVSNIVFLVNSVLKNSNACKDNIANFGKVSLPVSAKQKIGVSTLSYPNSGGPIVSVSSGSAKAVGLSEMNLTNFKLLSSFGGFNIVSTELEMLFAKPDAVGSNFTKRKVALQLRTNGAGTIVDCSGEGTEITDFQLSTICVSNGGAFDFTTKKCKLPEPQIPPPQIIVQQVPMPVQVPVAAAALPAVASSNASSVASASPSKVPTTVTAANTAPSNTAPSSNTTVVNAPPPVPKTALYTVVNPFCSNIGLITTSPTCTTRSFGVDGTGAIQFFTCKGAGDYGILYDSGDTCPNQPI